MSGVSVDVHVHGGGRCVLNCLFPVTIDGSLRTQVESNVWLCLALLLWPPPRPGPVARLYTYTVSNEIAKACESKTSEEYARGLAASVRGLLSERLNARLSLTEPIWLLCFSRGSACARSKLASLMTLSLFVSFFVHGCFVLRFFFPILRLFYSPAGWWW